ncbi:MAG: hypothetical protein DHS20C09_12220 [marine bacterium B5-7]|nr:MAG: hypothetical protein DHS20C09_12220 [marine bacterium B5-7]
MKKVLVVGASGATGKLLVQQLLQQKIKVIAIVRAVSTLTKISDDQPNLVIIRENISVMTRKDLADHIEGCDAVLSCLGHNLTFKGIFGKPRLLVTDTIEKISRTIESIDAGKTVKIILMNTTGNSNRDTPEQPPLSQRCVISLLRLLLPPHVDNEKAADFLRSHIGQTHKCIEWVVVRPDGLTNEKNISAYDIYPSPIRNPIFDAGQTSRINVANFMSNLVIDSDLWNTWKGKMPVIYNQT